MKCSVVITAYNSSLEICRALSSLADQIRIPEEIVIVDATPIDFVVVDDTSLVYKSDFTGLIKSFLPYDFSRKGKETPEYRLLCLPGAKTAEARNTGFESCREDSDVVFFLDADDEFYPEKISKSLEVMYDRDGLPGIVSSGMIYVDERVNPPTEVEVRATPVTLETLAERCNIFSNQAVHRSVLTQHLFDPSFEVTEDYEWAVRCAAAGVCIKVIPEPLHRYHKRPGSKTVVQPSKKRAESEEIKRVARQLLGATK